MKASLELGAAAKAKMNRRGWKMLNSCEVCHTPHAVVRIEAHRTGRAALDLHI